VFSRLIALLTVSLLLTALPTVAVVCGFAALQGDCCPPGTTSPCTGGDEGVAGRAVTTCCVASPTFSTARPSATPSGSERVHPGGSCDPLAASLAVRSWPGMAALPNSIVLPPSRAPRNDAGLTYLRTARLRI